MTTPDPAHRDPASPDLVGAQDADGESDADISEWVSEVRRLYVEPKRRADVKRGGPAARPVERRSSGPRRGTPSGGADPAGPEDSTAPDAGPTVVRRSDRHRARPPAERRVRQSDARRPPRHVESRATPPVEQRAERAAATPEGLAPARFDNADLPGTRAHSRAAARGGGQARTSRRRRMSVAAALAILVVIATTWIVVHRSGPVSAAEPDGPPSAAHPTAVVAVVDGAGAG
ncbi:hypothetical protein JQN72_10870 [Phycicoccus sp. CSK15P-2]|uniref:hypothetical protein n=1 Tax=Phycicoccus sp. CSK15P-2 TaxID=2807627 RepID=UPI001950137A|nr:hypothetical protein [Phycicoccus sp. CSK15P-2]MBM6404744.1 hypothetical protein [Phycicoccus sp. CSK15P-2]